MFKKHCRLIGDESGEIYITECYFKRFSFISFSLRAKISEQKEPFVISPFCIHFLVGEKVSAKRSKFSSVVEEMR
jgi:hypothetical protein